MTKACIKYSKLVFDQRTIQEPRSETVLRLSANQFDTFSFCTNKYLGSYVY